MLIGARVYINGKFIGKLRADSKRSPLDAHMGQHKIIEVGRAIFVLEDRSGETVIVPHDAVWFAT